MNDVYEGVVKSSEALCEYDVLGSFVIAMYEEMGRIAIAAHGHMEEEMVLQAVIVMLTQIKGDDLEKKLDLVSEYSGYLELGPQAGPVTH